MKELSIEEKAQRYDEAINRIKHYAVDEYGCSRIKVANVFPELAESKDERIIKAIKSAVLQLTDIYLQEKYGLKQSDCITWLEKQAEQKPAEWSEEDEKAIEDACYHLNRYGNSFNENNQEIANTVFQVADRLKSLRPHSQWKPSDEQLYGLDVAIATLRCQHNVVIKSLDSLYMDLKKLKD